jgi:superfamily I DNA/RNA helicase
VFPAQKRSDRPFRLLPPEPPAGRPRLDPQQQAVVDHRGGPLLVLAGPGTGKTTTLVEAVLNRMRGPGALSADEILVLTFSRAAAAELRDRIGARMAAEIDAGPGAGSTGSATAAPTVTTFHSFCFALVGRYRDPELFTEPLRLLSGPEQDVMIRDLVRGTVQPGQWGAGRERDGAFGGGDGQSVGHDAGDAGDASEVSEVSEVGGDGGARDGGDIGGGSDSADDRVGDTRPDTDDAASGWPKALRAALTTRGFAEELRAVILRARELGHDPDDLAEFAQSADRSDWRAAARFMAEYLDVADARGVLDYSELVHRAILHIETDEVRRAIRAQYRAVFVDEYQDTDPAQVRLLQALAGDGRDLVVVGDPDQSVYAFRGADISGILGFHRQFARRDGRDAPIVVLRTSRRAGPRVLAASRTLAARMPLAGLPAEQVREHRALTAEPNGQAPGQAPGPMPGRLPDQMPGPMPGRPAAQSPDRALPAQLGPSPIESEREHRQSAAQPDSDPSRSGPQDQVQVLTFTDQVAEFAAVADLLRRAHLEDAVPWEEMAVLVRAGIQLPEVRRALLTANVPVEVLGDDLPLAQEPAVAALLLALRCAAEPAALTPETARSLLTGPLGGLDGGDLRRLGRTLRAQETAALATDPADAAFTDEVAADAMSAAETDDPSAEAAPANLTTRSRVLPRPAERLICEAVADPRVLLGVDPAVGARALAVARLLDQARTDLVTGGEGALESALWTLWSGSGSGSSSGPNSNSGANTGTRTTAGPGSVWPERLRRAAERGGAAGRRADQDLDSVIALFAVAQRARERTGQVGVADFIGELQAEAIAADTLADKAHRGGAVQVLTAHKSKGLQWQVVVVAGVQDGLWPDLRRRGSLIEADRIGPSGLTAPLTVAALLAEERRLFYVAVTRARNRLIVTAVDGEQEEDESPSRFLRELGVEVRQAAAVRRRPLSVSALIAELRRAATDPRAPDPLRELALDRLAGLAGASAADGSRLVPQADPRTWWGRYDFTDNSSAVVDQGAPVPLSASAVSLLDGCGLRWFLEKQAAAQEQSSDKQGFGLVFHALAEEVAKGETAADIDVLMDRLDRVWDALPFDAPWKSEQERRSARRALERFLRWHADRQDGRTVAAAEAGFDATLSVGGELVRLRGSIDRIEVDADGGLYLVDFKTGSTAKTKPEVARDPQLGVYQLVVESGRVELGRAETRTDSRPDPQSDSQTGPQALTLFDLPWTDFPPDPPQPEPARPDVVQAELVYPREEAGPVGQADPTVRVQPGLAAGENPAWAADLVADVARRVLDERFNAYGDEAACRFCSFSKACPKQAEGRELPQ